VYPTLHQIQVMRRLREALWPPVIERSIPRQFLAT